ncbi:endonuclease III domain-containing protein [Thermocrinis jamiesonii]|uniref:endonuclease III domain-containing protein n=1 Tax=Thermocrinis jamiesonii TaxID=1302351 RepID=UPI000496DC0B|nr:endonuclease III [Thermocrinis jamiesonii]
MELQELKKVIQILRREYDRLNAPIEKLKAQKKGDPLRALICTLLSTRTKDETTAEVCKRLFERVKSLDDLLEIDQKELEGLLYPVGFYKNKAKYLKQMALQIKEEFNGEVPNTLEGLLKLKGVGRKVANIVLVEAFGKPAIGVDTHVHRICNRWKLVSTKTPEQTEKVLTQILPKEYWMDFNRLLVAFGQTICKPVKPKCDVCPIREFCEFVKIKVS